MHSRLKSHRRTTIIPEFGLFYLRNFFQIWFMICNSNINLLNYFSMTSDQIQICMCVLLRHLISWQTRANFRQWNIFLHKPIMSYRKSFSHSYQCSQEKAVFWIDDTIMYNRIKLGYSDIFFQVERGRNSLSFSNRIDLQFMKLCIPYFISIYCVLAYI